MGGNIPGGNFPGGIFQGGVWWVGIFRVGIFLEPYKITTDHFDESPFSNIFNMCVELNWSCKHQKVQKHPSLYVNKFLYGMNLVKHIF